MSGIIIVNRAKVLLVAITDPCLFDTLPQHCKDTVNDIDAKPESQRTEADVHTLAGILVVATHH
jgi:hypothetical protein